ncbi:hypothetical protein J7T55_015451 [Diaporthe amygdali]|uniref:uncharacterized protein n=1 Tax=Phomopsis amygdali TaxID=1214568 RepID=UPI0022FE8CE6|nr:uncharacterized protein J7T55_015451 [Diaporthe amygdali]KAJ0120719.1 hypothetical protein J7T55_015451 [Diaporthe amygdali]
MKPAAQTIREPQRSEAGGHFTLLKKRKLEHQGSLQELIGGHADSSDGGSVEMSTFLMRRSENDSLDGVAIERSSPETRTEEAGTVAESISCDRRSLNPGTTKSHSYTKLARSDCWGRLLKRRQAIPEKPKVVYSHKRRRILKEVLWVHLLPVAINFTLLGLYVQRVSWTPPWPSTNILNALQFAAKIHETLMIASLVSVLLHHIRYRLLSPGHAGLPLGLITSPFRLLDVTYLWSQEFSAAWRSLEVFSISEVATIGIHVFLFVLAAVLGPASAISMLPRLGEWELAEAITNAPFYASHDRNNIYQVYFGAELSDIFSQRITADFIPEACDYGSLSLPQTNICPRLGLMDITQGMFPPNSRNHGSSVLPFNVWTPLNQYNISVQAHNQAALPARIISVDLSTVSDNGYNATVDVTTPTDAILHLTEILISHYIDRWIADWQTVTPANYFVSRGEYPVTFTPYPGHLQSRRPHSLWKQPFVSSSCSSNLDHMASEFTIFDFDPTPDTPPYRVTLDAELLSIVLNGTGMGFIDNSNLNVTPNYSPSAAFAYTSQWATTLCLVQAYWIDSSLSGSPSRYYHDYENSMGDLAWSWRRWNDENRNRTWPSGRSWFEANAAETIHLDLDWLAVLDQGTGSDNTGIAEGLSKVPYKFGIHALGSVKEIRHGQSLPAMTLSPWTSSRSSETLRYNISGNWTRRTLTPSQIMENSTRLDFKLTQKLYGYRYSGVTIILAFVVLFLYVATVFVHISIMTFGTSWSSRAWKSLGEYFVLALHSPTPTSVLDNTGGGVKVSKTWQARASIQELQHGKRVGIVVADPGESDDGEPLLSEVQPDCKYS